MAYDPTLDKCIVNLGKIGEENDYVEFGIYQYNGGSKKLRVTHVVIGKGGKPYRDSVAKMDKDTFDAFIGLSDQIKTALG